MLCDLIRTERTRLTTRTAAAGMASQANDLPPETDSQPDSLSTPTPTPTNKMQDQQKYAGSAVCSFHSGRILRVSKLPLEATEEDIIQMLDFVQVSDVQLNKRTNSAQVSLVRPEALESWASDSESRSFSLCGAELKVAVSPTEHLLCVAHLPLIYEEEDFQNLVQMYGPLARSFLMRSQRTGNSKGYGFVQYATQEVALQARSLLQGKAIGNCTLHCDWLEPRHVTYESLHAKCLFVDHLPPDFRDVSELRHIFSVVVKPIYCQVVFKNREPTGVGLVEFGTWQEAEETQQRLNGHQMDKYKIRVTFCVPGVHAVTVFNQLTVDKPTNGKKPLLPDPAVNPALCAQLQVLAMHNPQFFQSLQAMATNQLQNLQNNNQVKKPMQNNNKGNPGGLLGSPPPLNTNPNVQAAMVLLLAAQVQMRLQQPAVFGNPQLLNNLQNLMKQNNLAMNPTVMCNATPFANGNTHQSLLAQMNVPAAAAAAAAGGLPNVAQNKPLSGGEVHANANGGATNGQFMPPHIRNGNGHFSHQPFDGPLVKTPLLPKPNTMERNGPNGFNRCGLLPTPRDNGLPPSVTPSMWSVPPPTNGHMKAWNGGGGGGPRHHSMNASVDGSKRLFSPPKTPLLGDRPRNYDYPLAKVPLLGEKPGLNLPPMMSGNNNNNSSSSSLSPTSSASSLGSDVSESSQLLGLPPTLSGKLSDPVMSFSPGQLQKHQQMGGGTNGPAQPFRENNLDKHFIPPTLPQYPIGNSVSPVSVQRIGTPNLNGTGNGTNISGSMTPSGFDANHLNQLNWQLERLGSHPLISLLLQAANSKNRATDLSAAVNNNEHYVQSPKPSLLGFAPPSKDLQAQPCPPPPPFLGSPTPPKGSLLGDYPWSNPPNTFPPNFNKFPSPPIIGQKRKIHSLLPPPESSPDGQYIGQHSQGLGGHYADTYGKRLRK